MFNILVSPQLRKEHIGKICFWSFSILLTANVLIIVFTAIGNSFCNGFFSSHLLYSNWLVSGLPFFYIGMGCHVFITKYHDTLKIHIHQMIAALIGLVIINFGFCKLIDVKLDLYLSYTPFTIMIDMIIFALSSVTTLSDKNIMVVAGEKQSRNVYLLHPFVHSVMNMFFDGRVDSSMIAAYAKPVFVILLSFAAGIAMNYSINLFRKRRKG